MRLSAIPFPGLLRQVALCTVLLTSCVAFLAIGITTGVHAAEADSPSQPERQISGHPFRRIFVPADRVAEVTRGNSRFLPVPRSEFERLIEAHGQGERAPAVWIERATFRASLEGNRLVRGNAELEVRHAGDAQAWLEVPFAGWTPASAHWADERPLVAGTYYPDEPEGPAARKQGIIVDGTGTIHLAWSAGSRSVGGGREFVLALPEATTTDFVLTASSTVSLSTLGAVLQSTTRNEQGEFEYHFAVRGGEPFSLRVAPDLEGDVEEAFAEAPAVRQRTSYHVTPSETRIDSSFRMIPVDHATRRLALRCPASVQIVDIAMEGVSLDYSEASGEQELREGRIISIVLPQSLPPGETELRVRALAATQVGTPMMLPSLELEGSTWLGGQARITVDDTLQVQDVHHEGFRATLPERDADLPEGSGIDGTQWEFEQLDPSAMLILQVGQALPRLKARMFSSVSVGRDEITAETTVDLTSGGGVESILRGRLTAGWEVLSVDSQPAGLVRSWTPEQAEGARSVIIVLDRPLEPQDALRLQFKARWQYPVEDQLAAQQLVPLRLARLSETDHWVELIPAAPVALSVKGPRTLPTPHVEDMPVGLRELQTDRRDTLLFAADLSDEPIPLSTNSRAAELTADIRLDVQITESALRHTCRLYIEPQSGEVTRLGVLLSSPSSRPPEWRLVDQSGRELAAEQLTSESVGSAPESEQSRVIRWSLRQPQTNPFELWLTFEQPWDDSSPLTLAALETTSPQTGTVQLSADPSVRLAVENRGLEPIPPTDARDWRSPLQRLTAYRFQPEGIPSRDESPLLVIRRVAAEQLPPAAWVRTAALDSTYLPNGSTLHHLAFVLESSGLERMEVQLPAGRRVLYRTRGGAWRQVASRPGGGATTLPLNAAPGRLPVEVRVWEQRDPLGCLETISQTPITFSVPVGRIAYRAWVPRGYQPMALPGSAQRLLAASLLWRDPARSGRASRDDVVLVWGEPGLSRGHSGPAELRVVHVATVRLWCFALLALGGWVGAKLSRKRLAYAAAAAAGGFSIALAVPAALAAPASAFAWGCLVAAVAQRLLGWTASVVPRWLRVADRPVREAVAGGAALFVCLGLCSQAFCVDPASAPDDMPPIPSVIDPIDENREPTGPNVFVPESLYSALLQRQRARQAPLGQWLLLRSHVRGALVHDADAEMLQAQDWRVLVELETFHPNAEVRLPLEREGAEWLLESARLDGARVRTDWDSDGQQLYVHVVEPGNHFLELPVKPTVRFKSGLGELVLPLPGTAECHLELAVPEGTSAIAFPTALAEVDFLPASSTYEGWLGTQNELILRWPLAPSSPTGATVDSLTWLHIGRTATRIDHRLVIRSTGDQPIHLEVVPPPGVRRLLVAQREIPNVRIRTDDPLATGGNLSRRASGSPPVGTENHPGERISITIDGPRDDIVVIPLQFVAGHAATAATVPVPRFGIRGGVQTAGRWTAIQPGAGQTLVPAPGTTVERVDPNDFVARWGSAAPPPDYAYREQPDTPPWRVAIERTNPRLEAVTSTLLVAQPSGMTVHYRADCQVNRDPIVVHRLNMPADFSVTSLAVRQGERNFGAGWHREENGDLQVLLPEPIEGQYAITLEGHLPAAEDGSVDLPLLTLNGVSESATQLTIARTPGTTLELEQSDSLTVQTDASLPRIWQEAWYLHGQYSVSTHRGTSLAKAKVGRARPPRDAQMAIAVEPKIRGWDVNVHCTIGGSRQPLDQLVFHAPKEWRGPYEVEPLGRWKLSVQEEPNYNRIILRPQTPPGDRVQVRLRGQVLQDGRDRVTVPAIRLVEPVVQESLVALPRRTSGQTTVWQSQNLLRVEDTTAVEALLGDVGSWTLHRRTGEPATARLSIVEPGVSAPLVSLVEADAWVGHDGVHVETTFTLDPRGRRDCEVVLRDGFELLDVRVNGRRPSTWKVTEGRWNLQLESSQLPQRISITSQRPGRVDGRRLRVSVPVLFAEGTKIPVLQTAWRVASDAPWQGQRIAAGTWTPASRSMIAAVQLANLVESLEELLPALLGSSAASWTPWLAYWGELIAAAQDRYAHCAASDPDAGAAEAVEAAQQRLAKIEETLAQTAHAIQTDPTRSRTPPEVQRGEPRAADRFDIRWLGSGHVEAIRLRRAPDGEGFAAERLLGSAMLILILVGGVGFARRDDRTIRFASSRTAVALFTVALLVLLSGHLWATILMTCVTTAWLAHFVRTSRHAPLHAPFSAFPFHGGRLGR